MDIYFKKSLNSELYDVIGINLLSDIMKISQIDLLSVSDVTLDLIPPLISTGIKDIAPQNLADYFFKVQLSFPLPTF